MNIMTPTPERKHHDFSPSTLAIREACPCYSPRSGTSEAAERGTAQHAASESESDHADLSDGEASAVAVCLNFLESRRKLMPGCSELREPYLPTDDDETTAGYADHVLISASGDAAEIFDWKYGKWAVEQAETNLQGIAYSLGIFFKYPKVQSVTMHFVQPALDRISSHTFTRADEDALRLRVNVVVERARLATADAAFTNATPNNPGCLFCNNVGRCPAVASIALAVGKKFHALGIPEDITPAAVLDPADVAVGLRLAGVVAVWAEAFRKQASERVICRGAPVPDGFELKEGFGRRSITDAKKFAEIALLSLTAEELSETVSYGLTDVEAKISAKSPRGQKSANVDSFRTALLEEGAVKPGQPFVYLGACNA